MAWVVCPNCGEKLSMKNTTCPYCGTRLQEDTPSKETEKSDQKQDISETQESNQKQDDRVKQDKQAKQDDQAKQNNHVKQRIKDLLACFGIVIFIIILIVSGLWIRKVWDQKTALKRAEAMVIGYDYAGALKVLKGAKEYKKNKDIVNLIEEYEKISSRLVMVHPDEIIHISFYNSCVQDPEIAFGTVNADECKELMLTANEFDKIINNLYMNGYVVVGIHDVVDEFISNNEICFKQKAIYLPEGKKAVMITIHDANFYHKFEDHGIASRLILDKKGKVVNEYTGSRGKTFRGSYDCITKLNAFLEEHPDGAYHGGRGTIALTGYNGVFGYRTDMTYESKENLDAGKMMWLDAHPKFNREKEIAEAAKIADALRAEGWTFASETWGEMDVRSADMNDLKTDMDLWKESVEPIVGKTSMMFFPAGSDIEASDVSYLGNKKYDYLRSEGFYYFFYRDDTIASNLSINEEYVRQSFREINGRQIWNEKEKIEEDQKYYKDLFDVDSIWDEQRRIM